MARRRPDAIYTNLFMHELLGTLPAGARVLDLGCGRGSFRYADYPGLLITAADLREPAEVKTWPPHVRFQAAAAEALPFRDETFELVVANFVFEHTQDFARAIVEAERVLAEGGSLYMAVPNARSFEDELYRALFAGGGHLQRLGLRGILRTVYAHTGLKLMAFAYWPAGYTFLEGRDGLRQFTLALVSALRRAGYGNVNLRSNFLMAFQKLGGIGHRTVPAVCSYCGGGAEALPEGDAAQGWRCQACGRITKPEVVRLDDLDRLEAEMADLNATFNRGWRSTIGGRVLSRVARRLFSRRRPPRRI